MKKGYKIINKMYYGYCNLILVCNYNPLNEVVNCSFIDMPDDIDEFDIGVWKIKKLKHD